MVRLRSVRAIGSQGYRRDQRHTRYTSGRSHPIALLISIFGFITPSPAYAGIEGHRTTLEKIPAEVTQVADLLAGVMDTSAQAAANPKAANVRMTTCKINLTDADSSSKTAIFLYQEQALATKLTQPYRQRFLQLVRSATGRRVESRSFKPATPSAWVNFCTKPVAERQVKQSELGTPVCTVLLEVAGEKRDRFIGETPTAGCPANVRGAVRITNHIELFPGGMETWDRGFDAQGKQVWGAKSESYQFRRN